MVTYTHCDESGVSLKAAGWIDGGLTDGGEWDRPSRPRLPGVDSEPKRRWWTRWSARAPKRDEEQVGHVHSTAVAKHELHR